MGDNKKLFGFGYGYTCDYLGHELSQRGAGAWTLAGTTRDPDKRAVLRARGIQIYNFDYENPLPDPLYHLEGTTHVVISTPPDDEGDPAFIVHGEDLLKIPTIEWVGYLSTTGVYGDREGGEVDETSELRPTSRRGSRRVKAEEEWLSLHKSHGLPVHVFRLAGIYGPGRSALDSVRAGVARRINKPGHTFARVHVEDIVQTLIASMAKPNPGAIYNVCDDLPAPSHEVIAYACELLGRAPPPLVEFDDANLAPITRSFYMDNRVVRNDRIKNELGVQLKYPDFRAGLRGCRDAEDYVLTALSRFAGGGAEG
ncbi:MAG: SDR family oxidoreductase [Alphaproteobacteria bacterium]|nr:SDR family oxidoreductase [Alphaproteobacteria bacterium]